jgi:hypothetical protein
MQLAIFVWTLDSAMFACAVALSMLLMVISVIIYVLQGICYRLRKWWKRGKLP